MGYIAGHRDAGLKQFAFIGLVLGRDAHRDGLQALKTRRGFEVGALLAAVQRHMALGTLLEVEAFAQHGGTVVAARSGYRLNHPRQTRARDVQGRAWTLRARARFSVIYPVL